MTPEQRTIYGKRFGTFADGMNRLLSTGIDASVAAARIIEIAVQHPVPIRAPIGSDAEEMLRAVRAVREKSDEELDALRLKLVGLS